MQEIIASLGTRALPVLPVVQVQKAEEIFPIGEALAIGGIHALEITLRTEAGLEAIALAKKRLPEVVICAGTVINPEQLKAAVDAGAEFIVTPGISRQLLETSVQLGVDLLPGIATPSELMLGREYGLTRFKLFPASIVGGVDMLKALAGPFPDVQFCPTGGLNATNFKDYLSLSNVFCVGGSWMIVKQDGVLCVERTSESARAIAQSIL